MIAGGKWSLYEKVSRISIHGHGYTLLLHACQCSILQCEWQEKLKNYSIA